MLKPSPPEGGLHSLEFKEYWPKPVSAALYCYSRLPHERIVSAEPEVGDIAMDVREGPGTESVWTRAILGDHPRVSGLAARARLLECRVSGRVLSEHIPGAERFDYRDPYLASQLSNLLPARRVANSGQSIRGCFSHNKPHEWIIDLLSTPHMSTVLSRTRLQAASMHQKTARTAQAPACAISPSRPAHGSEPAGSPCAHKHCWLHRNADEIHANGA